MAASDNITRSVAIQAAGLPPPDDTPPAAGDSGGGEHAVPARHAQYTSPTSVALTGQQQHYEIS